MVGSGPKFQRFGPEVREQDLWLLFDYTLLRTIITNIVNILWDLFEKVKINPEEETTVRDCGWMQLDPWLRSKQGSCFSPHGNLSTSFPILKTDLSC